MVVIAMAILKIQNQTKYINFLISTDMKKIIIFIFLILFEFPNGYSQDQKKEPKPKKNLISISEGVSGHTKDIYGRISPNLTPGNSTVETKPLFKLFYERNIATIINNCYLGLGLEFSQRKYNISGEYGIVGFNGTRYLGSAEVKLIYIAPRVSLNYVFPNHPKWRAYCNVNLGLAKYNATGTDGFTYYDYWGNFDHAETYAFAKKSSAYKGQFYIGMRGFIFNVVGIFAEAGYGMSYINAGLNVRF